MNKPIQRRIETLEVVTKPKRRVGLVTGLDGETVEQTLARLGLPDDDSHRWIVMLPMKRECSTSEGKQ